MTDQIPSHVVFTMVLMTPLVMELGFMKAVTKGSGLVALIVGTFSARFFKPILGSGIPLYLLAKIGHYSPIMEATITCENFFSGMGNAAYAALLMNLCDPKFMGMQYALLSSLVALTRTIAGAPTGYLAKNIGWENYYLIGKLRGKICCFFLYCVYSIQLLKQFLSIT